jgi:hypothetical protein
MTGLVRSASFVNSRATQTCTIDRAISRPFAGAAGRPNRDGRYTVYPVAMSRRAKSITPGCRPGISWSTRTAGPEPLRKTSYVRRSCVKSNVWNSGPICLPSHSDESRTQGLDRRQSRPLEGCTTRDGSSTGSDSQREVTYRFSIPTINDTETIMDSRDSSDPLLPLDFGIFVITWFIVVLFVIGAGFTAFGSGSLLGLGDDSVCATTRVGAVPYGGTGEAGQGDGVVGLKRGATSVPRTLYVCSPDPGPAARAGAAIGPVATFSFLLGSVLLTRHLIRYARRNRLFSSGVASRTTRLGWFLLAGSLLAAALQALSDGIVLSTAVRDVSWTVGQQDFHFPLTLVLVGLAAISVGRVLDRAVAMQEDADATI